MGCVPGQLGWPPCACRGLQLAAMLMVSYPRTCVVAECPTTSSCSSCISNTYSCGWSSTCYCEMEECGVCDTGSWGRGDSTPDEDGRCAECDAAGCNAGEYLDDGSSCTSCQSGKYQPSTDHSETSCIVCPAGKYDQTDRTSCRLCPSGRFLSSTGGTSSSDCTECAVGKYGRSDRTGCDDCPSLETSPAGSDSSSDCVPLNCDDIGDDCASCVRHREPGSSDYYSNCKYCNADNTCFSRWYGTCSNSDSIIPHDADSCVVCEEGEYLSGSNCIPCQAGKFQPESPHQDTTCIDCEAGRFLSSTGGTSSSDCTECAVGKYGRSDRTGCDDCPSLETSPAGSDSSSDCVPLNCDDIGDDCASCVRHREPGSSDYYSNCKYCNADNTCFSRWHGTCSNSDSIIPHDADSCVVCEEGEYLSGSNCIPCQAGKFQPESPHQDTTCIDCEAGRFLSSTGGTSSSDCTECAVGKYGRSDRTGCDDCPSLETSPAGSDSSSDCVPLNCDDIGDDCASCVRHREPGSSDYYSNCKYCNADNTCFSRWHGTCSNSDSIIPHDADSCVVCEEGEYLSGSNCIPCQAGKFQPESPHQDTTCIDCEAGRFLSSTGGTSSSDCTECAVGKYGRSDRTGCDDCPSLETSPAGSDSSSDCVPLNCDDIGDDCASCVRHREPGSSDYYSNCKYCNADNTCFSRWHGTCSNSDSIIPHDADSCVVCEEGEYLSGSDCIPCQAGKFQPESPHQDTTCIDCEAGRFLSSTGGTSSSDCTECAVGKYGRSDRTGCDDCPEGQTTMEWEISMEIITWVLASGSDDLDDCREAPCGTYDANCQACVQHGSCGYCRDSNACFDIETWNFLSADFYEGCGDRIDPGQASDCHVCQAGWHRTDAALEDIEEFCDECAPGQFQEVAGTTDTSCRVCAEGQHQANSGQASCEMCVAGRFQPSLGQSVCQRCLEGEYTSLTGGTDCSDCPEGKTSSAGSDSLDDCDERCDLYSDDCDACILHQSDRPMDGFMHCDYCRSTNTCVNQIDGYSALGFRGDSGSSSWYVVGECDDGVAHSECEDDAHTTREACQADMDCNNDGANDDPCEWLGGYCNGCPAGFSHDSDALDAGFTACSACLPGFFLAESDHEITSCSSCGEGLTSSWQATSADQCHPPCEARCIGIRLVKCTLGQMDLDGVASYFETLTEAVDDRHNAEGNGRRLTEEFALQTMETVCVDVLVTVRDSISQAMSEASEEILGFDVCSPEGVCKMAAATIGPVLGIPPNAAMRICDVLMVLLCASDPAAFEDLENTNYCDMLLDALGNTVAHRLSDGEVGAVDSGLSGPEAICGAMTYNIRQLGWFDVDGADAVAEVSPVHLACVGVEICASAPNEHRIERDGTSICCISGDLLQEDATTFPTCTVEQNCRAETASIAASGTDVCSGTVSLSSPGAFTSGPYQDHSDCRWSLSCASTADVVRLTITEMDTESDYDYINVYDSSDDSGSWLVTASGDVPPAVTTSTGQHMLVQLISDSSIVGMGFSAEYACDAPTVTCATGEYFSSGSCYDCEPGLFQPSAGHTEVSCQACEPGQYGTSSRDSCINCASGQYGVETAAAQSSSCIRCNAGQYQAVEGSTSCTYCAAGLTSFIGSDSSTDCYVPADQSCIDMQWRDSRGLSCNVYTASNLCTPAGGYGDAWDAATWGTFSDYSVAGVDATMACCGCGAPGLCSGTVSLSSPGAFTSGPYQDHSDCRWSLSCASTADVVRLTITEMDTESDYDYINVYDSSDDSGSWLVTASGDVPPAVTTSTGQHMLVQLTSDSSIVGMGFSAEYNCVGNVVCTQPSDITGYIVTNTQLSVVAGFDVSVTCDVGYEPTGTGPMATFCDRTFAAYSLSGCTQSSLPVLPGNEAPSPYPAPALSPDPAPALSPDPTPAPSPDPAPALSPDPAPALSPDPTPVPSPDPAPAPSQAVASDDQDWDGGFGPCSTYLTSTNTGHCVQDAACEPCSASCAAECDLDRAPTSCAEFSDETACWENGCMYTAGHDTTPGVCSDDSSSGGEPNCNSFNYDVCSMTTGCMWDGSHGYCGVDESFGGNEVTEADCVGAWSSCAANCTKTYLITKASSGMGSACPAAHGTTEACSSGEGNCPADVNCVGSWSLCDASCTDKVYTVYTAQSGSGTVCPTASGQTSPCAAGEGSCPLPCAITQYASGGMCLPCPAGSIGVNTSPLPSAGDYECTALTCAKDEYSTGFGCMPCPPNTENAAGDVATAVSTCDPVPITGQCAGNTQDFVTFTDVECGSMIPKRNYATLEGTTMSDCCEALLGPEEGVNAPTVVTNYEATPWTVCQLGCGDQGNKTRRVACIQVTIHANGAVVREVVANSDCEGNIPPVTAPCPIVAAGTPCDDGDDGTSADVCTTGDANARCEGKRVLISALTFPVAIEITEGLLMPAENATLEELSTNPVSNVMKETIKNALTATLGGEIDVIILGLNAGSLIVDYKVEVPAMTTVDDTMKTSAVYAISAATSEAAVLEIPAGATRSGEAVQLPTPEVEPFKSYSYVRIAGVCPPGTPAFCSTECGFMGLNMADVYTCIENAAALANHDLCEPSLGSAPDTTSVCCPPADPNTCQANATDLVTLPPGQGTFMAHTVCDNSEPDIRDANMQNFAVNACDGSTPGSSCTHTCAIGHEGGLVTCQSDGTFFVVACTPILCDPGQFRSGSRCQSCPAGQYQAVPRHTETVCVECAAGRYRSTSGASTCRACPRGRTSPVGSASAMDCAAPDADCIGAWSGCTRRCETAVERTWTETVAQAGLGAPCTPATDCLGGEGFCTTYTGEACAIGFYASETSNACIRCSYGQTSGGGFLTSCYSPHAYADAMEAAVNVVKVRSSLTFQADFDSIAAGTPPRMAFLSKFSQEVAASLGDGRTITADKIVVQSIHAGSIVVDFYIVAPETMQSTTQAMIQSLIDGNHTIKVTVADASLVASTGSMAAPTVSAAQPIGTTLPLAASRVETRIHGNGSSGILQMRFDRLEWGSVCRDGFNIDAARVVCQGLGYYGNYTWERTSGASVDFAADELDCLYTSDSLSQCTLNSAPYVHDCSPSDTVTIDCDASVGSPRRHLKNGKTIDCPAEFAVGGLCYAYDATYQNVDVFGMACVLVMCACCCCCCFGRQSSPSVRKLAELPSVEPTVHATLGQKPWGVTFEVNSQNRLVVAALVSDGAGARAGLREGLVLATVNDKAVPDSTSALKMLNMQPPLECALFEGDAHPEIHPDQVDVVIAEQQAEDNATDPAEDNSVARQAATQRALVVAPPPPPPPPPPPATTTPATPATPALASTAARAAAPMACQPVTACIDTLAPATVRHAAHARALRSELSQLKMPELRKRATDAGARRDAIEDARDANNPKEAMIALIVSTTMADRPTTPRTPTATMAIQIEKNPASTTVQTTHSDTAAVRHAAHARALRSELSQLKMPELRKRATDAGARRDAIEDARDANNPKEAMIALIVSTTMADRPTTPRTPTATMAIKIEKR